MEYSKSVFLVATCATTSEVLGFIRYNIIDPSAAVPESETKSERQLSLEARRPKTKPHLVELWKRFEDIREEEKDACYAKIHQGRRHTCMFRTSVSTWLFRFPGSFALNTRNLVVNLLMVDPKAQRRGIGKLLLEAVTVMSDREQIPTILCSSREARRLYSQMGFKTVQTWKIDNEYWAREIERHEPELSNEDQPWAVAFEGCSEEEVFMVRESPVSWEALPCEFKLQHVCKAYETRKT
jgi:GNAT superfamily N-acetyltransferase